MIARRLNLASLFLMPLTLSVLHADVTLRYKTDVTLNPALPAAMAEAATKGIDSAISREHVLRFKEGKGFSTSLGYDSITDFTTKEITFVDTAGKRYAKLKSDQVGQEMAGAIPELPARSREAMASMKASVTPARLTGRTAVIQSVDAEERELVWSMEGPAMPNMPPGPMIKMVLQVWTAKPGEAMRVPAFRELTGYSTWSYATMNPAATMAKVIKQFPGFSDTFGSLFEEMHQGTTVLRMHVDMFMPALVAMLQRIPGGNTAFGASFDPDSPFMQLNQEASEISNAPVPDSVFQVPEGYQEVAASELFKGLLSRQIPKGTAGSHAELIQSYVNRNVILRYVEDRSTIVKVKKSQLSGLKGTCDIAVQVTKGDWSAGVARFGLLYIGTPSVPGRPRANCTGRGPLPTGLEISGFSPDEAMDSLTASVAGILPTSEQYLALQGVAFNVSAKDNGSAQQTSSPQPGPDSSAPRILLKVDGGYTDAARRARLQGDVTVRFVVGVDGHAHEPSIVQGMDPGIDENALRAVSMWLFEPARRAGQPVQLPSTIQMNFRLL
ncbi:MAG TPA: energy transducer TonB [Bryobacteraceae bacterium]|jgi:TonB family protein|nr:energy transducer TonB [Bryobacteraceae bacterium]